MDTEMKSEGVLAAKALEVAVIELLKDKYEWGFLGQRKVKFLVPLWLPGHFYANPALAALPIGVPEETSPVKVQILFYHVLEPYPENRVITKLMTKLFLDVLVPLL